MSDNRQRAAEALGFRELEMAERHARDDVDHIAAALDAAEARGRAEELRAAADEVPRFGPEVIAKWLRDRADAWDPHRYDADTCRCICGALDHPEMGWVISA